MDKDRFQIPKPHSEKRWNEDIRAHIDIVSEDLDDRDETSDPRTETKNDKANRVSSSPKDNSLDLRDFLGI